MSTNPVKGGRSKKKPLTIPVCKEHVHGPDLTHRYYGKPIKRTLTSGSCAICADKHYPGNLPPIWI